MKYPSKAKLPRYLIDIRVDEAAENPDPEADRFLVILG